MKVNVTHEYDCNVDDLYRMFCDPDFYVRKFEACGARNIEVVESGGEEGCFSITVEREVPSDAPAFLKSFIGEWNSLTQSESWEGEEGEEYYNDIEVKGDGVPVQISGSMNLSPSGDDDCVNDIEFDIQCHIPLVGKKLAQFVASDLEKTLDAEFDFISEQIAD